MRLAALHWSPDEGRGGAAKQTRCLSVGCAVVDGQWTYQPFWRVWMSVLCLEEIKSRGYKKVN